MKTLLVLALVVGVALWFWNENNKKEEKTRADAAAALEAKRAAAAATPFHTSAVTTGNKLVYDPATGRYVEQKSNGSVSRGAAAKPKGGTMLDQPVHR